MAKIKLSKPVLAAELEIDSYHLAHPFIKLKKVEALWYLLCATEELMLKKSIELIDDPVLANQYVDEMKYVLKYCMQWVNLSCLNGGIIPSKSDQKLKNIAIEFLNISKKYQIFVVQYTLAYEGFIKMDVENHSLTVDYPPNYDSRIEAYNSLIIPELEYEVKDKNESGEDLVVALT